MISPDTSPVVLPIAPDEIQENKRNGQGHWMFTPEAAVSFDNGLSTLREYGDFTEMTPIIDELSKSKAVLVEGAPGSGKSHLIRDVQTGCIASNIPAFCLTMHVNAGKRSGAANARVALDEFKDKTQATGGLVILDNADFVGYKGSGSRSRGSATEYAQTVNPLVSELLDDPKYVILATAHDDEWREGKWKWEDPQIDKPAQSILEAFPARFTFEGKMALVGLAHILHARNLARAEGESPITLGQAAQTIRMLHQSGRANFFHAQHLPVGLFLEDPGTAIQEIDAGRAQRRGVR